VSVHTRFLVLNDVPRSEGYNPLNPVLQLLYAHILAIEAALPIREVLWLITFLTSQLKRTGDSEVDSTGLIAIGFESDADHGIVRWLGRSKIGSVEPFFGINTLTA
jgi:hypothetical protein